MCVSQRCREVVRCVCVYMCGEGNRKGNKISSICYHCEQLGDVFPHHWYLIMHAAKHDISVP